MGVSGPVKEPGYRAIRNKQIEKFLTGIRIQRDTPQWDEASRFLNESGDFNRATFQGKPAVAPKPLNKTLFHNLQGTPIQDIELQGLITADNNSRVPRGNTANG